MEGFPADFPSIQQVSIWSLAAASLLDYTVYHIFSMQVPGRLGLLVTLNLILMNVYNSVNAPTKRGFSFIEVWLLGVEIPILVGILEYGMILSVRKYKSKKKATSVINVRTAQSPKILADEEFDWNSLSKSLDKWTFIGSILFIMIFNIVYWSVALNIE